MAGNRGRKNSRRERGRIGKGEDKALQRTNHSSTQQNPIHQEYPFSPPISCRQTRHSGAVLPQLASLPSTSRSPLRGIIKALNHSSSIRAAVRTLNEPLPTNEEVKMLELQHCTSPPSGGDLVCVKDVKGVRTPVSTVSPSRSSPTSKQLLNPDNMNVDAVSEFQGPREAQQITDQDLHGQYQLLKENRMEDKPEKSTTNYAPRNSQCLSASRTHSLNITEVAKRLQDDIEDDPDEVESALDLPFDYVNGHRVKKEFAPVLRAMSEKYGDITSGSQIRSSFLLSVFLERLCDIYQRLQQTTLFDISHIDLNNMLDDVRDLEHQKLNVGWLLEKLEYISQTKTGFQEYLSIKGEQAKYDTSTRSNEKKLEAYQRELALTQQKISAEQEELAVNKAKADHYRKIAADIKARVLTLGKQSLVHGLL